MLNYIAYLQALRLEKNKKWESALATYQKIAKTQNQPTAKLAYRIGFVAEKIKDWETAETWLQRAVEADPTKAQWHYRLALAQELNKKFSLAVETYGQAIALQPKNPQYLYRLGKVLWICGKGVEAEKALHQAIELDPQNPKYAYELVAAIRKQGRTWQEVEALQAALALDAGNAQWQFELGEAQDKMNRFAEAGQAFAKANTLDPGKALWHFREGWAWERAEQDKNANAAYTAAIAADEALNAKDFGIGVFHQQRGFWSEAVLAYSRTIQKHPSNAELHYRLGLAYDRCYEWEQAAQSYRQALLLDIHQPAWHYRLGFVLERLERWQEAVQAYREAVQRSSDHKSMWYYRMGYVLVKMGEMDQAAEAFLETRIFKCPHGVDMSRYEKNKDLMQVMEYTEYLETLPIKKKTILYESFLGASLGCNPYAIYQKIVDKPEFSDFTHVWSITDETELPFDFVQRPNTILIKRQSSAYRRYVATVEYLINNVSFPFWFIRREGQKYLNTWHGTPLKGLGKDMPGEFMVHGNVTRNFLHATHLISPNAHTSDAMMKSYGVAGIFDGMLAETGYPRIDSTLNSTAAEKTKLKKQLGLSDKLPVVLYAPTWRGVQGKVQTDVERILQDIKKLCADNYQLVFRGHHFAEKALKNVGIPVVVAGQNVDANQLLAITDVLITDYSSIFFDFLPTRRPIIYYAYDLEEYSATRGLYFPLDTMPGSLCQSINDVLKAIQEAIISPEVYQSDKNYQIAREKYAKHEDGKSTQRAIDFFFNDVTTHTVQRYDDSRTVALFYNGQFIPNGITSSFLNLMKNIPEDKMLISVAIEPSTIKNDPDRIEKFQSLPEGVRILPKEGRPLLTPEEAWVDNAFMGMRGFVTKPIQTVYRKIYKREFIRLYGVRNRIEKLINFEGYSGYWTQVFAHAGMSKNNIAWLHSDMCEEYKVRMPHLTRNFSSYFNYKKLVSVSLLMNETNKKYLSSVFQIDEDKFRYCDNNIDSDSILDKAEEPLEEDLKAWFSGDVFLTIGRLSPEKDQEKLIHAFLQLKKVNKNAKLVIIGDGPLRNYLAEIVQDLNLETSVFLAGQRSNPFPALKACSCFVLSSNHEGQPIVLIEALVLGKKIVATDIDGNRGIIERFGGNLVDNSISGLFNGMLNYSSSPVLEFNSEDYKKSSTRQFMNVLI